MFVSGWHARDWAAVRYAGPRVRQGQHIHEIGHAVGLWHEQSREDRDRFIRILFENIEPGQEHNFDQHITDGDDIGRYDFGSIMHYDKFAFSKNDQPTIETLNGEDIGQRSGLSDVDVQAVNFMYPLSIPLILQPGLYTIQQQSNGRFVDAHEYSGKDFGLVTRPAQNNRTQQWIVIPVGGVFRIQQRAMAGLWTRITVRERTSHSLPALQKTTTPRDG